MPRKPREFGPGALTHLTAHGVDDQPIFRSALDQLELRHLLKEIAKRIDWQIITWCFMTTHYHLLVGVGRDDRVPWAMQTVNSVYAREFNARHRRRGHVLGERYTDTYVGTEAPRRDDRLHPGEPGTRRPRPPGRGLAVVGRCHARAALPAARKWLTVIHSRVRAPNAGSFRAPGRA